MSDAMRAALREAYMAFADRCEEYIEGEDMSAESFLYAWKSEVETRILAIVEPKPESTTPDEYDCARCHVHVSNVHHPFYPYCLKCKGPTEEDMRGLLRL